MHRPLVDRPSVNAPYPVSINAVEHNPQAKIVLERFRLQKMATLAKRQGKAAVVGLEEEQRAG